ncbi:MAG: hypothetical protein ACOYVF_04615 [Candidatus Zixiibacteriota bacterium]
MIKIAGENRFFYSVLSFLIFLHLFLIFRQTLYPFLDLPGHLAAATIYKYISDPESLFADYYAIDIFLKPNIAHLLFCSTTVFSSVMTAHKIFLGLYVILFPVSTLLLIKKLNGNIWYTLLVFPYLYNYNLMMGFVGFAIAVPLVILFCRLLGDYTDESTPTFKLTLSLCFILLYFVHALASLFALLVFAVYCRYRFRRLKKTLWSLMPALPAVALLVGWWISENGHDAYPGLFEFASDYYLHDYFPTLLKRARLVAFDNYRLFPRYLGYSAGILFFIAAVGPALYGIFKNRGLFGERLKQHRLEPLRLFLFCALTCFVLLPAGLPGQSYLYHRFAVYVCLFLIIIGAALSRKKFNHLQIAAVIALGLLHFGLYFDYFRDFDRANESIDAEFFSDLQPDGRLVGMIADKEYRGHAVYIHFPDYYIVFNRGINATCLTKHRFGTIRRRTSFTILAPYEEDMRESAIIDEFYPYMDYILGRGKIPEKYENLMIDFRIIRTANGWSLYKRIDKPNLLPETTGDRPFNP